jgi:hypothetical protein
MKTLTVIFFALGFSVFGYAQSREIYYEYDGNGNRVMRFVDYAGRR